MEWSCLIYFSFLEIDDNFTKPDHCSINYKCTTMFFSKKKFIEPCFAVHVNSSFILVGLIHLMFGAQDDLQGVLVYP